MKQPYKDILYYGSKWKTICALKYEVFYFSNQKSWAIFYSIFFPAKIRNVCSILVFEKKIVWPTNAKSFHFATNKYWPIITNINKFVSLFEQPTLARHVPFLFQHERICTVKYSFFKNSSIKYCVILNCCVFSRNFQETLYILFFKMNLF